MTRGHVDKNGAAFDVVANDFHISFFAPACAISTLIVPSQQGRQFF
jgi:hypothetical protein